MDKEADHVIDEIRDTGHYIGGHRDVSEKDQRDKLGLVHLDRLLLHLGCNFDDDGNIGGLDGSLNVLIAHVDLRERRFDRLRWLAEGHGSASTADQRASS